MYFKGRVHDFFFHTTLTVIIRIIYRHREMRSRQDGTTGYSSCMWQPEGNIYNSVLDIFKDDSILPVLFLHGSMVSLYPCTQLLPDLSWTRRISEINAGMGAGAIIFLLLFPTLWAHAYWKNTAKKAIHVLKYMTESLLFLHNVFCWAHQTVLTQFSAQNWGGKTVGIVSRKGILVYISGVFHPTPWLAPILSYAWLNVNSIPQLMLKHAKKST